MSAPRTAALVAEAARYPWWPEHWAEIDAGSREAYDRWVGAARGRRAARRARVVSRRIYGLRPWAGPVKRRWEALGDFIDNDRALPTDVSAGPSGWAP
jgi:hypothetical protein